MHNSMLQIIQIYEQVLGPMGSDKWDLTVSVLGYSKIVSFCAIVYCISPWELLL